MPPSVLRFVSILVLIGFGLGSSESLADSPPANQSVDSFPLFAIQFRIGPKWDTSKAPNEQALFREHSANLKRLRDAGNLIVGARFSDIGLIILAAESEAAARAMVDADPSIAVGTFTYEIHPFNVFYPGTVRSPSARPITK